VAAGNTYEAIATQTLGSAAASVTFSSIPSTYTDIRLIVTGSLSAADNTAIRLNGDTGSNYSSTYLGGNGSAASSGRFTSTTQALLGYLDITTQMVQKFDFMNYSNTTTNKTILCRSDSSSVFVEASVGLWRNTAAINEITLKFFSGANFNTGSTFTLYGIKAA
jgi:hypothetical protein